MKSESYMLSVAMRIANEGPNSRVVFFLPSYQRVKWLAKTLMDNMSLFDGSKFVHSTMTYVAECGGQLRLMVVEESKLHYLGGIQPSHAFHVDVSARCESYIATKIRSAHPHKTPVGIYSPYEAFARMDY